jgi:hypothetical protein
MSIFKVQKPFISFRIYMCVDEDDDDTARQFSLKWDKEYNTWYLDGHIYEESQIAKQDNIKNIMKPFRVYGKHQYFL